MEDDYGYDQGFLSPEILEDYENQTVEEYYMAHPDRIPQKPIKRRKPTTNIDSNEDNLIEENPINLAIARLDYLIAELEAGRIPNQKQPDKEKVKVTIVSQGRQSSNSNKTISSRAAYNKDDNRNAIVTLLIIAIIALLLIYALI